MKTLLTIAFAMTMAACAAENGDEAVETTVTPAPMTASTFNNGGGTGTKTIGDLQGDGYTCQHQEGTTLTLCWKGGSTWSCNEKGVCIEMLTTKPPIRPIYPLPIATAVLAP
jgi:hypothetical protein